MKKLLVVLLILVALIAGGLWYIANNAGGFIKEQVETQGTAYLGTSVSLANVDLNIGEGRLTLNDLDVENPQGFSNEDAFSLESVTLDLGDISGEPYRVQSFSIAAPEMLYELNATGTGNLMVLKDNLMKKLPKSSTPPKDSSASSPLVIIDNVQVSKVRLKLDFENLDTAGFELPVDQRVYEVELPTFSIGGIGQPDGLPADQVGAVIANKLLDKVIDEAKAEAKRRAADAAKEKLQDKAKEKLGELFGG
ncbi:hypothetical protein [Alteromonas oceanisediminis]|uniref:hypothetical protein n=1 Tax=Alteromonas oceanisediminis TaxID=2836180 RepID=UPI001BDA2D49|nr:hypothetical protein [Alteromonas oceanisediminis]MBT0588186.1 hypothetical protein [Alteromonas oceanisediminis]